MCILVTLLQGSDGFIRSFKAVDDVKEEGEGQRQGLEMYRATKSATLAETLPSAFY